MKRRMLYLSILILGLSAHIRANPVMLPMINEVLVDSTDWRIELATDPEYNDLQGFYITTRTDTALLKTITTLTELVVLAPDSLISALYMNPAGDSIGLWDPDGNRYNEFIYGNCLGSKVAAPKPGQSINDLDYFSHYLDSSPTIGVQNDTEGATGFVTGVVTDTLSNPLSGVLVGTGYHFDEHYSNQEGVFTIETYAASFDLSASKEGYDYFHGSTLYQLYPGETITADSIQLIGPTVAIERKPGAIAGEFSLSQNYPNPFNPTTTFAYELPREDYVSITLYDLNGQHLTTLFAGRQDAGKYTVRWDASTYSSGMYMYKVQTSEYSQSRKCTLVK